MKNDPSCTAIDEWFQQAPAGGERNAWERWWQQAPKAIKSDIVGSNQKTVLSTYLPYGLNRPKQEAPELAWTVRSLLEEEGGDWLFKPDEHHETMFQSLLWLFSDWAWPVRRSDTDYADRRALFLRVTQAVPDTEFHRFSVEESKKAFEPYREIGNNLLGCAYFFEAWQLAEQLESLGQGPIPTHANQKSPLMLAGVPAWKRAIANGWKPLEKTKPKEPNSQPQWRRCIGPLMPLVHEGNDPLRKHVLEWAQQQDPAECRRWLSERLSYDIRHANTLDNKNKALAHWGALSDPHLAFDDEKKMALWTSALIHDADFWWPYIEPHFPSIPSRDKERAMFLMANDRPTSSDFQTRTIWSSCHNELIERLARDADPVFLPAIAQRARFFENTNLLQVLKEQGATLEQVEAKSSATSFGSYGADEVVKTEIWLERVSDFFKSQAQEDVLMDTLPRGHSPPRQRF